MEARRARLANGDRRFRRMALVAGRRGGKTMISALAATEEASVPDTVGCMFAPTYPMVHDVVIPAFRQFFPEQWCKGGSWDKGFSESHLTLETAVNSIVHFRSLDNPDRARGMGLHWCSIDEACMLPRMAWEMAVEPTLTEHKGVAWIATSPRGFDWVHDLFWLPATQEVPGYWAARYRTCDNPIIDAAEIDAKRLRMDPTAFRQEYEADFVNFTGAIYGDLVDGHILSDLDTIRRAFPEWPDIDRRRAAVIGVDPAAEHPFAASLLIASELGWVACGEYRERNKTLAEHVGALQRLAAKFGARDTRYVVDRTAKQVQIELAQYGLFPAASESHVESGIMRVQSWFRDNKLWILAAECPKTLEELRSYRWDDTTGKDGQLGKAKPFKKNDDLADALRYAVMSCSDIDPLPLVGVTGRSLASVPEEARWSWAREQRINKEDSQGEDSWVPETAADYPLGDFWGN